jgi:hypothetical protein
MPTVTAAARLALLDASDAMRGLAKYESSAKRRACIRDAAAAIKGLANGESFSPRAALGALIHSVGKPGAAIIRAVCAYYMRPDMLAAAIETLAESRPSLARLINARRDSRYSDSFTYS